MDRNFSSTTSTHSRLESLSTACAPVTSSYHGTSDSSNGSGKLGNASSSKFGGSSAHSSPTIAQRGWVGYDWDAESKRSMPESPVPSSSSKELRTTGLGIHGTDDHPDRTRKLSSPSLVAKVENGLVTILEFPSTLLALILSPLNPPSLQYSSPQLGISTSPTPKLSALHSKRHSLPLRLLTFAYLSFSVAFFALRLAGNNITATPSSSASLAIKSIRITPRADTLHSPVEMEELYRTRTAVEVESGTGSLANWAKKMGERVSWNDRRVRHSAVHAGERAKAIRAEMSEVLDAMGSSIVTVAGGTVGVGEIARIGQAGQFFACVRGFY